MTWLDGPALAQPLPEPDYLVRALGLVGGPGACHVMGGYGYSGKSLILQSLLLSLTVGLPVWGAYECVPRRVLHVDLEQGRVITVRRYQRLAWTMGIRLEELGNVMRVGVYPQLRLVEGDRARWREEMGTRDVLVVDSLRTAVGAGVDENSSEVRRGIDMLSEVSEETGCRPILIAHTRKTGVESDDLRQTLRGSSAIFDAADTVYALKLDKDGKISLSNQKSRSHGDTVPTIDLAITDVASAVDPRAGIQVTAKMAPSKEAVERAAEAARVEAKRRREEASRIARQQSDAARVLDALQGNPGASRSELQMLTGLTSGLRWADAVKTLGTKVRIESVPSDRGGKPATRYHLV